MIRFLQHAAWCGLVACALCCCSKPLPTTGEAPGPELMEAANKAIEARAYAKTSQQLAGLRAEYPGNPFAASAAAAVSLAWGESLEERDTQAAREKYQSAVRLIADRLRMGKLSEEEYQLAMNVHIAAGGPAAAVNIIEEGIRHHPESRELKFQRVRALTAAGRYSDALHAITELEAMGDVKQGALWMHAHVLRLLGRYEEAIAYFDKALAVEGDSTEAIAAVKARTELMLSTTLTEDKFWEHYEQAAEHQRAGRSDREAAERAKALEVLEYFQQQGQRLEGGNGNNEWFTGKCHQAIASGLEMLGEYEQACVHARHAMYYLGYSRDTYAYAHGMFCTAVVISNHAAVLPKEDPRVKELRQEAIGILRDQIEYCKQNRIGHVNRHAMALLVRLLADEGMTNDPDFTLYRNNMMPQPLPEGGPNGDCSIAQAVMTEARLSYEEGDYKYAAKLYEWCQGGAGNYSAVDNLRERFRQYSNLVHCYKVLGDSAKLTECGERLLDTADAVRQRLNDDYTKRTLLAQGLQAAVATTAGAYVERNEAPQAFTLSERYKGRALMELLRGKALAQEGKPQAQAPPAEAAPEGTAPGPESANARAATDALAGSTMRDLKIEETAVKRLKEDTRIAGRTIESLGQDLAYGLLDLAPMAKDFTLVSYLFDNDRGVALVLNDDDLSGVLLNDLSYPRLMEKLQQLRDSYTGANAAARDLNVEATQGAAPVPAFAVPASEALYDMLITPVLPYIKKPLLYLSTDGLLNYLPFDLLQKDGRYLVQDFAVAYTPSATFLKWLLDKPAAGRSSILAIGNPNLKNPAFRLVNAGAEAQAVRTLFSSGDAFLEDAATESAVYAHAQDVDILHFACHGQTNEDNPMLSSLRLAPDDANDGYLHAGEVFDMSLKPSLVVLSACNSGMGEVSSGNELMGLTRSFFYAGAQSIIASLWFVDDRSTSELMQAFYKNLSTMNIAEALRQAKLEAMAKYPDPIHWAPFALQGDFR